MSYIFSNTISYTPKYLQNIHVQYTIKYIKYRMFFSKNVRVQIGQVGDDPERHQVFKTCHLSFSLFLFLPPTTIIKFSQLCPSGHFFPNVSPNPLPSLILTTMKNYSFSFKNSFMMPKTTFTFDRTKSTPLTILFSTYTSCASKQNMVECYIIFNHPISSHIMFHGPLHSPTTVHLTPSMPCNPLEGLTRSFIVSLLFSLSSQQGFLLFKQPDLFEFHPGVYYFYRSL